MISSESRSGRGFTLGDPGLLHLWRADSCCDFVLASRIRYKVQVDVLRSSRSIGSCTPGERRRNRLHRGALSFEIGTKQVMFSENNRVNNR